MPRAERDHNKLLSVLQACTKQMLCHSGERGGGGVVGGGSVSNSKKPLLYLESLEVNAIYIYI